MVLVPATLVAEIGGSRKKHETLSENQTISKRTWDATQMVEYLHSKYETLSSLPRSEIKSSNFININIINK
jgi:predicted Mrr-cat superfamily restriction endonuclease